MKEIINKWNLDKAAISSAGSPDLLIRQAKARKKQALGEIYGNIIILVLSFFGLGLFFYHFTPVKEMLSRIGISLMLGGLLLRITIEVISMAKSRSIAFSDQLAQTAAAALSFYTFRRKIHGPVTLSILVLYGIGFYLLTPEFSLYIPSKWMIAMHVSFPLITVALIWVIRKGIRKEMASLKYFTQLQQAIATENEAEEL